MNPELLDQLAIVFAEAAVKAALAHAERAKGQVETTPAGGPPLVPRAESRCDSGAEARSSSGRT
jgi:hypothetical protein